MRFVLKDVGPFPEAEIKIDGLTVISGLNGTGKSTLLKTIYSILEGSWNLEDKLRDDVFDCIVELMRRYVPEDRRFSWDRSELIECVSVLRDRVESMNDYDKALFGRIELAIAGEIDSTFHERALYEAILDEFVSTEQVIRHSKRVTEARVEMEHNSRSRSLVIRDRGIVWTGDYADLPGVTYYDCPSVMDGEGGASRVGHRRNLHESLCRDHDDNIIRGVVNDEVSKRFDELVSTIVPGSFSRQGLWYQYTDENGNVFELQNIAAGMKVFSMLKILMEKGFLNGGTVLLLDEPESNLHPKWIDVLGDVIAILSRDLCTRVILTTNSPQLLMAVGSSVGGFREKVRHYNIRTGEDGTSVIEDIGDRIGPTMWFYPRPERPRRSPGIIFSARYPICAVPTRRIGRSPPGCRRGSPPDRPLPPPSSDPPRTARCGGCSARSIRRLQPPHRSTGLF